MGAAGAADPTGQAGRRPRQTDMRAAMNAIFYLLRTGCPFFPARSTVYNIFCKFQREGVWERIWEELLVACGLARRTGPRGQPDRRHHRQPVAEGGGKGGCKSRSEDDAVGHDAGNKVKGRALHALSMSKACRYGSSSIPRIQDRDAAGVVLDKIRQHFPWLELVWADSATTPTK